ncbi:MAG: hypothetical protein IKA64_05755 [Clostridia bacterium]|nr:hypothetical protein [Clostridia bacterium]
MKKKIVSILLLVAMIIPVISTLASCKKNNGGGGNKTDALVLMTENLDGLFNPFFSTSATDSTIVSMTQIGMLSSKYVNGEVEVAFGEDEAVVTKDYELTTDENGDSVYTFVIKNGILFSDGHPLTIEDVLFNLYLYLDPVYTGSATIYSTAIKGLTAYRKQDPSAKDDDDSDNYADQAYANAEARLMELIQLYMDTAAVVGGGGSVSYSTTIEAMKEAIKNHSTSYDYDSAIMTDKQMDDGSVDANAQLLKDYENALKKFKEELYSDYESAKDAFTEEPYKSHPEFKDPIFCFFFAEGYVSVEYAKKPGTNEDDRSKIVKLTPNYDTTKYTTVDAAVERVYSDMTKTSFHQVLQYSITAQQLLNEFTATAKDVLIHNAIGDEGLSVPSIDGIKSLAHTDRAGSTITVNGNEYTIATQHDANGVPEDGYDVLEITVNDVDPKAQWNFAFTVAPQHYYGEGAKTPVDIANDQFGVDFSDSSFMMNVVQSLRNIKIPMGAGAYKATDRANSDNPSQSGFYTDGVVYFKANQNFHTVGTGLANAKIEKIRYQEVSASNAIGALKEGSVHYITPQLTKDNYDKLKAMESEGYVSLQTDQLGYGYIGINATHIPNINIRKAIMCAMNTTLALDYYYTGSASQIYWPMSKVSWAYPTGNSSVDNGKDYPQINEQWNEGTARTNIQKYMDLAEVSAGDPDLKIEFTIAGANLQDHPTYKVFRDAAALLNSMGWDVTVEADTQALTKINTGALAVWAAAWGSTIDPDMYQVYHKNSSATSTKGWGYETIKKDEEQKKILDELSELIDLARESTDKDFRKEKYELAMGKVLDLAVELPVYQRSTLYAYNANVIKTSSLPTEINPYSSPLDRIWEIELK